MDINSVPFEESNAVGASRSGDHVTSPSESQPDIQSSQERPAPFLDGLTMRDLANALVVGAFRNGFIETLHSGQQSELLADPSLSRITDLEMKKLNIEMSAQLAYLLTLCFEQPAEFIKQLNYLRHFTNGWERHAVSFELPRQFDEPKCCRECSAAISSSRWHFCPGCGTSVA